MLEVADHIDNDYKRQAITFEDCFSNSLVKKNSYSGYSIMKGGYKNYHQSFYEPF